jgi:hypothetical protein
MKNAKESIATVKPAMFIIRWFLVVLVGLNMLIDLDIHHPLNGIVIF